MMMMKGGACASAAALLLPCLRFVRMLAGALAMLDTCMPRKPSFA